MNDKARSEKFLEIRMPGTSDATKRLREKIARLNAEEKTNKKPFSRAILIEGPTGAGKEFVAREICAHWIWQSWESAEQQEGYLEGHRVVVQGLEDELAEQFHAVSATDLLDAVGLATLVGSKKGAFTGAIDTVGILGSSCSHILVDEIPDASRMLQGQLLRILQNRRRQPVGGSVDDESPIAARILFAGNRPLRGEVAARKFREDLYRRMAVRLQVPGLQAHPERVRELVDTLTREILKEKKEVADPSKVRLTKEDLDWAAGQPWPGNVRQLRNTVEAWIHSALLDATPKRLSECLDEDESPENGTIGTEEATVLALVAQRLIMNDQPYKGFKEFGDHFHALCASALHHTIKNGLVDQDLLERRFGKTLKGVVDQTRRYYKPEFTKGTQGRADG